VPDLSEMEDALSKRALVVRFWDDRRSFVGYASRTVWDADLAQDIFQEACARFLASKATFFCYEASAKYFYRIIRSLVVDYHKRNRRLLFPGLLPEMVCEPETQWQEDLIIGKLCTATRRLSSDDQRIVAAYICPDLPNLRARSRAVDLPISTFRYQAQRALGRIRKLMNKRTRLISEFQLTRRRRETK
jgi:DNA-directed RNA polymerase specialized sigma24 family protein